MHLHVAEQCRVAGEVDRRHVGRAQNEAGGAAEIHQLVPSSIVELECTACVIVMRDAGDFLRAADAHVARRSVTPSPWRYCPSFVEAHDRRAGRAVRRDDVGQVVAMAVGHEDQIDRLAAPSGLDNAGGQLRISEPRVEQHPFAIRQLEHERRMSEPGDLRAGSPWR